MSITRQQLEEAQKYQFQAAHDTNSKVRLIAGPGTGKSYAIGERILWLLSNGTDPKTIYVASFTNAATEKLGNSISKYCREAGQLGIQDISISTLHSLSLRALRLGGRLDYPVNPQVLDDYEVKMIVDGEFSNKVGITPGRAKNVREDHEAFSNTGVYEPINFILPEPPITKLERSSFLQYHNPRSLLYSYVLPGEIVRKCVNFMNDGVLDPSRILNMSHLILDEYQDFNPADIEFVELLSQKGVTVFVAGDDDQSIYSFRFANPEGIQRFISKGDEGDHQLPYCFRCTPNILNTGLNLLNNYSNPSRIQKELISLYKDASPENLGIVTRWNFISAEREAATIVNSCEELINSGINAEDIMILLSNTDLQLPLFIEGFTKKGILFHSPKVKKFIDTDPGRFVLSIFRIICNTDDYVALRLIFGLCKGTGFTTCNNVANKVLANPITYKQIFEKQYDTFFDREKKSINKAKTILDKIVSFNCDDKLDSCIQVIKEILVEHFSNSAIQDLDEEVRVLPDYTTIKEARDFIWEDNIERKTQVLNKIIERGQGVTNAIEEEITKRVKILTMHGAKGLDSKIVFIPGLEKEILPGSKRQGVPGLVLEAARMLYVSITRARAACFLSYSTSRMMYGKRVYTNPSPFVQFLGGPWVDKSEDMIISEGRVEAISNMIRNL